MTKASVVLAVSLVLTASAASGQRLNMRTAVYFERYTSNAPLFSSISELTVPISLTSKLGNWGNLTVSGGFVKLDVAGSTEGADRSLAGALDTEARVGIDLLPGKITLLFSGAIPTGIQSVENPDLSVLAVVSRDIIGFAASDLGTGGYVGTGVAGAFPAGEMAVGLSASYRYPFEYQPLVNVDYTLQPGAELRVRAGLEGPIGQRTYLRMAGIVAARQRDAINNITRHSVGTRATGYFSLEHGIGSAATATLYGFDVFRGNPQIQQTATGAAFMPRGNLFALGAQYARRVGVFTDLVPGVEYRLSHTAQDDIGSDLQRTGSSLRIAVDVHHRVNQTYNMVIKASYLTADMRSVAGVLTQAKVSGFQTALLVEVRQ